VRKTLKMRGSAIKVTQEQPVQAAQGAGLFLMSLQRYERQQPAP
jgi:hypothetical protein